MSGSTVDLSTIKIGDEAAWLSRGLSGTSPHFGTVVKLTPTQIVVETMLGQQERFRREDGRRIGGPTYRRYLLSPTDPEVLAAQAVARTRQLDYEVDSRVRAARYSTPDEALMYLRAMRMQLTTAIGEVEKLCERIAIAKAPQS